MRRMGLTILSLSTAASFAPVVDLTLESALAGWFACPLDEGSMSECIAAGFEIGDGLDTAEVLGWLALLTSPGMLASVGP